MSAHLMVYVALMRVKEGVPPIPQHKGGNLTTAVKLMVLQYSFLL